MTGLYEYQIRILKQDMGKMFIPMFFYNQEIEGKLETVIRYDLCDYISLSEWLIKNNYSLLELLDILENIVLLLDKCKEVLINYEDLKINSANIYISPKNNNEVKLQYIPKESSEPDFSFYEFAKEIENQVSDTDSREYMGVILKKIETDRPNLSKIINLLGQIKRDIYICGWIGKNRTF